MIVSKAANKITILMGLTIMQISKNFKSNKLLRIYGRSNTISKTLVKHINNRGWANTRYVRGIICRGGHVGNDLQGSRHKVFSEQ